MSKLTEKLTLNRSRATCLANVKNLNVWGSDLEDISIVREMVNLEVLNLSVNNVTTLKDLSFCPRLRELYLRKNQISNLDELKFLKNLPRLRVLWLADNPCSSEEKYRETVIRNLPNLTKVDSEEISPSELTNATEIGNEFRIDENIPNFDGLDLNHTLTLDAVQKYVKQHDQKPKFEQSDEQIRTQDQQEPNLKQKAEPIMAQEQQEPISNSLETVSHSVDIDDVNRRRAELGLKQLHLGSASLTTTTIKAGQQTAPTLSRSVTHTTQINSYLEEQQSHVLSAVLLLLNDMNTSELHKVVQTATDLIQQVSVQEDHEDDDQNKECIENYDLE